MTVYKYPIPLIDVFTLTLPVGAEILHVATQHGDPMLWCRVDETGETETRQFALVGTGHPAPGPDEARHVGTFLTWEGTYVWHLFERLV